MTFHGRWTANTKYEQMFWIIPTVVITHSYDEWSFGILWLSGGLIIDFD